LPPPLPEGGDDGGEVGEESSAPEGDELAGEGARMLLAREKSSQTFENRVLVMLKVAE